MRHKLFFLTAAAGILAAACTSATDPNIGTMSSGHKVSFIQNSDGGWGIEITADGLQTLVQDTPVEMEVSTPEGGASSFRTSYSSYRKISKSSARAYAAVDAGGNVFDITDIWSISEGCLLLDRTVTAKETSADTGFSSSIHLDFCGVSWSDALFFAPGLLYGDSTFDGPTSPGGTRFDAEKLFTFREDFLPSPMYGVLLPDGYSLTVLDMAPDCSTTLEETRKGMGESSMTDVKFKVGSFDSKAVPDAIAIGYTLPSKTGVFPFGRRRPGEPVPENADRMVWCSRYNPVQAGFSQHYRLAFRIAEDGTFPLFTRNSYRWAWSLLKPEVFWHDIELVRTCLADQLSSLVTTFEDRTGLPYQYQTKQGKVWERPNDPAFFWRAPLGFVGKHIESAVALLYEGSRDTTVRGRKMREQGLAMIETAIKYIPTKNPVCGGVNLMDGTHSMTNLPIWYIREHTDDMVRLLEAYLSEKENGLEHPEWLEWCRDFADWALKLQREDGSFPRSFMIETAEIVEESGTTSYNVVPMFVKLSAITGDSRYIESAVRAADFVWESYGKRGVFIGGAIDNPNITDKEAGMLSMEAFLSLYEATDEQKWLERARTAADFAETWTWIWNVPIPEEAPEAELNWSHGVPTIGVQGITAQVAGHVDQFLDMAIPAYAKLYKYTGDEHYYDFARILMHNCKAMIALPGRMYGMCAPGFQTENFRMGADRDGRGYGTPEKWMPWVTTNHLTGINMMEAYDSELFSRLCAEK